MHSSGSAARARGFGVLLIAHRGARALASENTMAAFLIALDHGADGLELDVRRTRDGALVIMHDDDVATTTGGTGRISGMNLTEVRALDAAFRAPDRRAPEPVPTLPEVLHAFAGRTRIYVELKPWFDNDGFHSADVIARAVCELIGDMPGVTVSSFDPAAVAVVRELLPRVPTGLGCLEGADVMTSLRVAVAAGHAECHVPESKVDASYVRAAHEAGRRVLAWTVNDSPRLIELRALGVDGVFTDDPAAARAALEG